MDEKSCCFIGHRDVEETDELIARLSFEIESLIQKGVTCFIFGSRSDFNGICHDVVTELKGKYPDIKRVAYNTRSECATLESERAESERVYRFIFKEEVHLRGYEESITPDKMYVSGKASYVERNQIMIDLSDYCIFYYDKDYAPPKKQISKKCVGGVWTSGKSGTAIAYDYAIRKKKNVINVFQN